MWRYHFHLTARELSLVIGPAHFLGTIGDRYHANAIINGAHQRAEITTDAILFTDLRDRFAGYPSRAKAIAVWVDQADALMRAIFTGNVTEIATDAFIVIDSGDPFVVQVERFPFLQGGDRLAHKVHHAFESLGVEIIVQAFDHILNDTEAVMHDRGANLHAR